MPCCQKRRAPDSLFRTCSPIELLLAPLGGETRIADTLPSPTGFAALCLLCTKPFAGICQDLNISSHFSQAHRRCVWNSSWFTPTWTGLVSTGSKRWAHLLWSPNGRSDSGPTGSRKQHHHVLPLSKCSSSYFSCRNYGSAGPPDLASDISASSGVGAFQRKQDPASPRSCFKHLKKPSPAASVVISMGDTSITANWAISFLAANGFQLHK